MIDASDVNVENIFDTRCEKRAAKFSGTQKINWLNLFHALKSSFSATNVSRLKYLP